MIAVIGKFLLVLAAVAFLLGVIWTRWRRRAEPELQKASRVPGYVAIAGYAVVFASLIIGAMAFLSRTRTAVTELQIASGVLAVLGSGILIFFYVRRYLEKSK